MTHRLIEPPPSPQPVDWPAIEAALPWFSRLYDCPQDPVFHAEGNVGIHTRMVVEALMRLPGWHTAPADQRLVLYAAALLHDVAKPDTTRREPDGRVTAKGHSRRGAIDARVILWRLGVPFRAREEIAAIVEHHQLPFFLIADGDYRGRLARVSQSLRCNLLADVAEADGRGRICPDLETILENIELFREAAREEGCFDRPYGFASDHTRVTHALDPSHRPHDWPAFDDRRGMMWITSGLPGVGKDTLARAHLPDLPMISLDDIREELGLEPDRPHGEAVQAAKKRAKEFLRKGQPFLWNATHLSRAMRARTLALAHAYGARTGILYVEAPEPVLRRRNREREKRVPDAVIDRMLHKWEVPSPLEAHEIHYLVQDGDGRLDRLDAPILA